MQKLISILILITFIPIIHFSHLYANDKYKQNIPIEKIKFSLPAPELTKAISFGYDNLIADFLWIQFIQYLGSAYSKEVSYIPEVYSLINTVVTLDPKFNNAYIVGAYALEQNKEFDKAIALLDKGIKNTTDWYIPYQAGFLYYIKKKNKKMAVVYFEKARKYKEAESLMNRLIANMKLDIGDNDFDFQIDLWKSVYEQSKKSKDTYNMDKATKNIVQLTIKKDLAFLQKIVDKYNQEGSNETVYPDNYDKEKDNEKIDKKVETKPKKRLENLNDLLDLKIVTKLPFDPLKRPYSFDPVKQEVISLPLPWEKKK